VSKFFVEIIVDCWWLSCGSVRLQVTSVLTHVFVFCCVNIYFGSSGAFSFLKIISLKSVSKINFIVYVLVYVWMSKNSF